MDDPKAPLDKNEEEKASELAAQGKEPSGAVKRVRSLALGVIAAILLGLSGILGLVALEAIRLGTRHVNLVTNKTWLKNAVHGAIEGFGVTYKVTHLCLSVLATIGLLAALFALIARLFESVPGLDKVYEEVVKKWSELLSSKESGKAEFARFGSMIVGASIVSVSLLMVSISVKEWVNAQQQADQKWDAVNGSLTEMKVELGEVKGILTKFSPNIIQDPTKNEIFLHAQRSGIVKTVWSNLENHEIDQGTKLVELDCEDLHKEELLAQAQLEQLQQGTDDGDAKSAEAELKIAEAELHKAKREKDFMKALKEKDAISDEQYAVALSGVELAISKIALANAKMASATAAQDRRTHAHAAATNAANRVINYIEALRAADCFVVAPAKGTVTSFIVKPGAYISTTSSTEVARFVVSQSKK
jgi:biotin carboxyl carrier protein